MVSGDRTMAHTHHDHPQGRGHTHGQGHTHAPASFGRAFAVGIALNGGYLGAEACCGVLAHSTALLADAGHNLSDVLGLGTAWVAASLARRRPSRRFTYGLRRSSILSALSNAIILLLVTGGIAWEAILRLIHPAPVAGATVMIVAGIGILVNGGTALLFMSGSGRDLNLRATFVHMASDALMAAAVVAAGAVIWLQGPLWVDPAASLLMAGVIVWATWSLLRQSLDLALDAVPAGIDRMAVERFLRRLPGVVDLHDLHIWGMSTTETALTAHLVRPGCTVDDALMRRTSEELSRQYGIDHATFQIEHGGDGRCPQAADGAL